MTTGPDWDHSGLAQEVELDEATAEQERAAIVAWLREQPAIVPASPSHVKANRPEMLADAIERGDHLSTAPEAKP